MNIVNILFRLIAIAMTSFGLYKVIAKYILKSNYNILHFVYILFYMVQTLPIIQEMIFGIGEDIVPYGITYKALTDSSTDIIYSLFIISVSLSIYYLANRLNMVKKKRNISENKEKIKNSFIFNNKTLRRVVFAGMFITIPFILFAPSIKVYTSFAYFYCNDFSKQSAEYLFHTGIMGRVNMIAFFCTIIYYMINKKKENNIYVFFSAFLFTWINQKRTMILFFFLAVLFIDFFLKDVDKKKLIKKAIIFFLIEVVYFIVYILITGKGSEHSINWMYTFYFSRMAHVKVSIYDLYIARNALTFPGQSLIAEIFWFIPRFIWNNKPYPYNIYYTAFVYGKPILETTWNFQVNMWSEFISNFGFFGPIFGITFLYYVSKIIESSTNIFAYFFGILFIALYCVFGCEGIVLYSMTIFLFINILVQLNKKYPDKFNNLKHISLNKILIFLHVPDKLYLQINYFKLFHCFINFRNPKTLNEKLQWLKIYDRKDIYTTMVDKYEMKKYVEEKIGKGYTVETLGVYNSFDEINFDKLPNKFVIKCTHDSGGLVVVTDKKKLDIEAAREKINKSLKRNYYLFSREWPYKNVKPRIIIEKYMVDESGVELKDYKIFCFNGKAEYVEVDFNRFVEHKLNPYDFDWKPLNFCDKSKNDYSAKISKPKRLEDMRNIAETLSKDMAFLRVDFYSIKDKIYVGELTLYPGSGFIEFEPRSVDLKYGKKLDIGGLKK